MQNVTLLNRDEVADRLSISTRSLIRHESELLEKGLVRIRLGTLLKYPDTSINKLIKNAMRTGQPLF